MRLGWGRADLGVQPVLTQAVQGCQHCVHGCAAGLAAAV